MVQNAAHDGGVLLGLGHRGILGLILVNSALFAVLAYLVSIDKSGLLLPNFVIAALGGVTAAAFTQWILFEALGYGSPYAVAKHAFALGSLFVVAVVTVILDLLIAVTGLSTISVRMKIRTGLSNSPLAPILFMGLALGSLWWNRPSLSLRAVEAYDHDAQFLAASKLGSEILGNTVSFNTQFPTGINFAIAKGSLNVAGYNQIEQIQIFFGKLRTEEQTARYFLISPVQASPLNPNCEVQLHPPLAASKLLHARCYEQLYAASLKPR
jgi:hypothetical protein